MVRLVNAHEGFHIDGTPRCAVSGAETYDSCVRCHGCGLVWWWKNITIVEEGPNRQCLCLECFRMIDLDRLRRQVMSEEEAAHAAGEVERLQSEASMSPHQLAENLKTLTDQELEAVSILSGFYIHKVGEPF